MYNGLLASIVSTSNQTKCMSLSSQKYMVHHALINLYLNEYIYELHYYPFAVKLDRYVGSYNTLNDLSNAVCLPNKTGDLNIHNMITGTNGSEISTKHGSLECKSKFDDRKCNVNQNWNHDKRWCEFKKHHICGNDYIRNSATCSCKNGKYLASIF